MLSVGFSGSFSLVSVGGAIGAALGATIGAAAGTALSGATTGAATGATETGTTGAATGVTIDAAGCSLTMLSNSLNASPERFLISLVVFMMFLEPMGKATNT